MPGCFHRGVVGERERAREREEAREETARARHGRAGQGRAGQGEAGEEQKIKRYLRPGGSRERMYVCWVVQGSVVSW